MPIVYSIYTNHWLMPDYTIVKDSDGDRFCNILTGLTEDGYSLIEFDTSQFRSGSGKRKYDYIALMYKG